MKFDRSHLLRSLAHSLIPGGSHTYAKGDDQYPIESPGFISRGEGSHVWDVDDNEFIEYGMGMRSVSLGHGHPAVAEAAYKEMRRGANFTRPSPIEIESAKEFLDIIAGAEMVKFSKNGSDVTSAAVRLSRAYTGRDLIAVCKDQPFFSVDDWFIGSTPMRAGIPKAIQNLTVSFEYNNIRSVRDLFERWPRQIACLIMEAEKEVEPGSGFLQEVVHLCHEHGTVFVLDEMITGFRWHLGGAQRFYGLNPDLSTFGKALGNGFSVAALAGKREIMRLGGIEHDSDRVFLLSYTHGAETHALAAAREVMRIYKKELVIEALWEKGALLRKGIEQVIATHGMAEWFQVTGRPCCLAYATLDEQRKPSQKYRTLFLQEIIKRGILAPSFVVSYAHTVEDINRTIEAVDGTMAIYRKALEGNIDQMLEGRSVKPVFRCRN